MMDHWTQVTQTLVDVAMGRSPADLVIRSGCWVCVQSGEVIPKTDVAIKGERIAFVGPNADHTISENTVKIDADDRYLVPGLLDGHTHIESGMLTVGEFVRAVLPSGTTGLFVDPHEIANVFGLNAIRLMTDEAASQPIHVWIQMPSCVPSAPGLETSGAEINLEDVYEGISLPGVIGLGEMMNFPGIAKGDINLLSEVVLARIKNKVVGGHYASHDLGLPFHAYVASGIEDDHEGTRYLDSLSRIRQGMKVMLRYGSVMHDVADQIKVSTELGIDYRHIILVTDGTNASTLLNEGHMDRVVRHAIQQGVVPVQAIQMATLNTAEHFGLARDIGQIAPCRFADILLISDLPQMKIDMVIAKGRIAVKDGELLIEPKKFSYPSEVRASVHVSRHLVPEDFIVPTIAKKPNVVVNVIGVIPNQALTKHFRVEMEVVNSNLQVDIQRDICKIAVVERHHNSGRIQVGFVQGFGLNVPCAIGTTFAHDSHQIVVVGTDELNMARATNELISSGGGQIVVKNNCTEVLLELPIAGLMSDQPVDVVAQKTSQIINAAKACGCPFDNPNSQLSYMALVSIPELRLSDKGLVDVTQMKIIPLIENDSS